jgi:hypothetical protein
MTLKRAEGIRCGQFKYTILESSWKDRERPRISVWMTGLWTGVRKQDLPNMNQEC